MVMVPQGMLYMVPHGVNAVPNGAVISIRDQAHRYDSTLVYVPSASPTHSI